MESGVQEEFQSGSVRMTLRAAVLGSPIQHSLSPAIHNLAYRRLGIDAKYQAIEVKESDIEDFLHRTLVDPDHWLGFSLTMPLKEAICVPTLASFVNIDARSQRIGSANTLYKEGDRWQGTSTDVNGFQYLLKDRDFSSISILGAGGTARAALAAIDGLDGRTIDRVSIFRRSAHRDELIRRCSKNFEVEILPWEQVASAWSSELVINTVPVEGSNELAASFQPVPLLLDSLYSPWPPPLSSQQFASSGDLISGLDLLSAQALDQISLMTKVPFDQNEMFDVLLTHLRSLV